MARDERRDEQAQGRRPSDTETLVGETAASDALTDERRAVQPPERDERTAPAPVPEGSVPTDRDADREAELGHS